MIIDKDKLKEYIHTKYGHKYRVVEIHTISIRKNSVYNQWFNVIRIEWAGWQVISEHTHNPKFKDNWTYVVNRLSRFKLEDYQEWLIDIRNKKLEELLDY
jgi:hypothetical protein